MKTIFFLHSSITLSTPSGLGDCGKYAVSELVRLASKLSCTVTISERKTRGFRFELCAPGAAAAGAMTAGIKNVGYVIAVAPNAVTLAAKTEKGLLNAVYDLFERLGITYLLPTDDNEIVAYGAPLPLECGSSLCNMLYEHTCIACETGLFGREDYPGREWMRYFAKLRFDTVFRHAGGHIRNFPDLGFRYGDGAHGNDKLLSPGFKAAHPETCRMTQPDDFGGTRVNDHNFCFSSETAWKEIERNFVEHIDEYRGLDHIIIEFAHLPGGGLCYCSSCRNYTPSDIETLVMNRYARILRKHGVKATVQVNAYHDTMLPGETIEPDRQLFPNFAARERCWAHPIDDKNCPRNHFYMHCLEAWSKKIFPKTEQNGVVHYSLDQILFRGMYPFIADTIYADFHTFRKYSVKTYQMLQTGGHVFEPDHNLMYTARLSWNPDMKSSDYIKWLSLRIAGKDAASFAEYLKERLRIFKHVLAWCGVDPQVTHLDYRWLKEDDSEFSLELLEEYRQSAKWMKDAGAKLAAANKKVKGRAHEIIAGECRRASFESEIIAVMALQQEANIAMPKARNTLDPKLVAEARNKLEKFSNALQKSAETAAKVGQDAYYTRSFCKFMLKDVNERMAWCDTQLAAGYDTLNAQFGVPGQITFRPSAH